MTVRRFPTSAGVLYYGSVPSPKDLQLLRRHRIDVIWNLAEELDLVAKEERRIAPVVIRGNIEDYSVPANVGLFMSQVRRVANYLKAGKKVFVHCMGGRGRTGMALAALKIALEGGSAEKALAMIKATTGGPDTQEQKDFIEFYAPFLRGEQTGQPPKFPVKPKPVFVDPWEKYRNIDWREYMQGLPPRELKPICDFCGSKQVVATENFDGKKVQLCNVCKSLWDQATDEEKKEWLKP